MTSTTATKTYFVRDTTRAIVLTTSNPHEVAAFLGSHKPNDYVVEIPNDVSGWDLWAYGGDWLPTYEEFKPWLRDEPPEPAAEGSDGPDGDDGTAEAVATFAVGDCVVYQRDSIFKSDDRDLFVVHEVVAPGVYKLAQGEEVFRVAYYDNELVPYAGSELEWQREGKAMYAALKDENERLLKALRREMLAARLPENANDGTRKLAAGMVDIHIAKLLGKDGK